MERLVGMIQCLEWPLTDAPPTRDSLDLTFGGSRDVVHDAAVVCTELFPEDLDQK